MRSNHLQCVFALLVISNSFGLDATASAATATTETQYQGQEPDAQAQQGWSPALRKGFYHTPQGSPIMPYKWFLNLETADGTGRFADETNLGKYGFIPSPYPKDPELNPDGLPIGLTIEPVTNELGQTMLDQPYLGMTCAACHTGKVSVNGTHRIVDGAPGMLDFDKFVAELSEAIKATADDNSRLVKLASSVTGSSDEAVLTAFSFGFKQFKTRFSGKAIMRRPQLQSGHGRVDALTQIINSMAARDQAMPQNLAPIEAPVSYPQIWRAPELEYVQWNPIAASPIVRNGGQVLGVFGSVNLSRLGTDLLASTIRIDNLKALEDWLEILQPPKWDEAVMGAIDKPLADKGKELFEGKAGCIGCHNTTKTDSAKNYYGKEFIKITRIPYQKVGTDSTYFDALLKRDIEVGPLAKLVLLQLGNPSIAAYLSKGDYLPAGLYFAPLAYAVVDQELKKRGVPEDTQNTEYHRFRFARTESGIPVPYQPKPVIPDNKASAFITIKAPLLQGVWATGPYLHNGSVPTIDDLLKPADQREKTFWTGGTVLDTKKLGFVSGNAEGRSIIDTSIKGNQNIGHEYPATPLDEAERAAIIEYLKTL